MRNFMILLPSFWLLSFSTTQGQDALALLDRPTWFFTTNEIAALNAVSPRDMEPKVFEIIRKADGYPAGKLVKFGVVDLNNDGKGEMLTRIDIGSRVIMHDVGILYKESSNYVYVIVESNGPMIPLREKNGRWLIIGDEFVASFHGPYGWVWFPVVYSWNGKKCENVSRENWDYYKANVFPAITNAISQLADVESRPLADATDWEVLTTRKDLVMQLVGEGLKAKRLAELFPQAVLPREHAQKLNDAIARQSAGTQLDSELKEKVREVQNYLQGRLR